MHCSLDWRQICQQKLFKTVIKHFLNLYAPPQLFIMDISLAKPKYYRREKLFKKMARKLLLREKEKRSLKMKNNNNSKTITENDHEALFNIYSR